MSEQDTFAIAVLDDYQQVALSMADWSVLDGRATVTVFSDHLADQNAVVARLQPFDIICVMRSGPMIARTELSVSVTLVFDVTFALATGMAIGVANIGNWMNVPPVGIFAPPM